MKTKYEELLLNCSITGCPKKVVTKNVIKPDSLAVDVILNRLGHLGLFRQLWTIWVTSSYFGHFFGRPFGCLIHFCLLGRFYPLNSDLRKGVGLSFLPDPKPPPPLSDEVNYEKLKETKEERTPAFYWE